MKTLLVIFGITGDLSTRKLLPALSHIIHDGNAPELNILGVSRREADVQEIVLESTKDQQLADITKLFTMDVAELSDYQGLKQAIAAYRADQTLVYLSVPPGAAAQIVDLLGEAGINTPDVHLLFEKPFGFDLASAEDFIARTGRFFADEQIYRVDHYMAKEIAHEVLRLRRNAENHHHHWNNQSVAKVSVVASEKIGIEGRAQFYEQTGALRDFVQGHLMQLLSLVLINKPGTKDLPAERLEVLERILPADPEKAARGQYKGYQEEAENPGSLVETFVSLQLESDDPDWKGVELQLITGKALSEKRSYIQIDYTDGTSDVFEEGKVLPQGERSLDAYERVLLEAVAGRKEIFTTSSEVLRSWTIVAPVQESWSMDSEIPSLYAPGMKLEA